MDTTGLISSIVEAALAIDFGRKGFATRGKEHVGRVSYERGIFAALSVFKDAASTSDPQTIVLVEYTFLAQELEFSEKTDNDTLSSLTKAILSFDDAFLALKVVEDKTLYQGAENTHPHNKKYRISGFPKDSFHIACISHKTRIQNILRSPGIDPIEKSLLKQRFANLSIAQNGYIEKQMKVINSQ